jgi:acyl dehydratase
MAEPSKAYDIEAVRREWIGKASAVVMGRYPVEYDPIRRLCHMVEDRNPLFLDPEYAKTTSYGSVIAPPVMADYFAGQGAWPPDEGPEDPGYGLPPTPGNQFINLSQTLEFYKPVRVGDRLSGQGVITDVYEKPIRLDPKAVWIVMEARITNQDGELVTVVRNTVLKHRTPEEVAADVAGVETQGKAEE